jgi:predicted HicB family RNase H-like nuclease
MVTYDGTGVRSIETNFRGAVDEYLAFCEAEGKTPNKPYKGNLNIRLSHELHRKASRFAEQRDQKLNAVINDALEHYLAHAE